MEGAGLRSCASPRRCYGPGVFYTKGRGRFPSSGITGYQNVDRYPWLLAGFRVRRCNEGILEHRHADGLRSRGIAYPGQSCLDSEYVHLVLLLKFNPITYGKPSMALSDGFKNLLAQKNGSPEPFKYSFGVHILTSTATGRKNHQDSDLYLTSLSKNSPLKLKP